MILVSEGQSQVSAYLCKSPYDSNMQPDLKYFQNWRHELTNWKWIPSKKNKNKSKTKHVKVKPNNFEDKEKIM